SCPTPPAAGAYAATTSATTRAGCCTSSIATAGCTSSSGREGDSRAEPPSSPQRRPAILPRLRRFQLRREAEQRRLVAEARDELHAEWQPALRHRERYRHRRVTRRIEQRREPNARRARGQERRRVRVGQTEDAEWVRRLRHGRRQQDVVLLEESRDRAARAVHGMDRARIVGGGERARLLHALPGDAFDVVLAERSAQRRGARLEREGQARDDDGAAGLAPGGFVELRARFLYMVPEARAELGGPAHSFRALRIHGTREPRRRGERDAESSGIATDFFEEGPRRRRRPVRIADVGTRRRIQ